MAFPLLKNNILNLGAPKIIMPLVGGVYLANRKVASNQIPIMYQEV